MSDKRYRSFMLVLYPDDETHQDTLLYIQEFIDNYAFILHDKDFNENGEIKKAHYHVVIKLSNNKTISALAKELKIGENYITPTHKSYVKGLRYLIHADDEDKYQYDFEEVIGPLKKQLKKSLTADKDEADAVIELLELIEKHGELSMQSFVRIIASSGLWSVYRRNSYTFNLLLSEHNYKFQKKRGSLHNIYYRNLYFDKKT